MTVLSMEQSDTTASSGFMIAEAQRRSGAYSDRHPDLLDSRLDRIREWLGRELRRERLGAEKSGVGAVSIRRREAVGLGHGDIRTKPISIIGTERQQTVQSHVSGVLALPFGEIPDGHRWDSPPKIRFAPDSPLEGAGFEPSVPLVRQAPELA